MASKIFPLRLPDEMRMRWQAAAGAEQPLADFIKESVEDRIARSIEHDPAEMSAAHSQWLDAPREIYRTKSGRVLTDADIEALADEAERGYDPDTIVPTGRIVPSGGKRTYEPDPRGGRKK